MKLLKHIDNHVIHYVTYASKMRTLRAVPMMFNGEGCCMIAIFLSYLVVKVR